MRADFGTELLFCLQKEMVEAAAKYGTEERCHHWDPKVVSARTPNFFPIPERI